MAIQTDNRNSQALASAVGSARNKKLDVSNQQFFQSMQAERKTASQFNKGDGLDEAMKGIEKSLDFTLKMMLATAKNMGLPGDNDSGSKSREMGEAAHQYSQAMIGKASIQGQQAVIDAQKNPPIDLQGIVGDVVEYNDDTKFFMGQDLAYNYKIKHQEQSSGAMVNLKFTVTDENGKTIKTDTRSGVAKEMQGDHKFIWDGKDDNRDNVLPGNYTLRIEAFGKKTLDNGVTSSFDVTASAVLSGVVQSVRMEKGIPTGIMVDGRFVNRDQIVDIRDGGNPDTGITLDSSLIMKNVELNFSRAQVRDGQMDVYFNNTEVENPGNIIVKVSDEDGKYLKTLTIKENVGKGVGMVTFTESQAELENGNYNIRTYIEDVSDPGDIKEVEVSYQARFQVAKVSERDGWFSIVSDDNAKFNPYNIESVVGNYLTPLEQKLFELDGARVSYRGDFFEYGVDVEPTTFMFELPQMEAVITYGNMSIYDAESQDLVAISRADFNAYELLDDASRKVVGDELIYERNYFGEVEDLNDEQTLDLNRYIVEQLQLSGSDGEFRMANDAYQAAFFGEVSKMPVTFQAWDGEYLDGDEGAKNGNLYRAEFMPIYSRNSDNSTVAGQTDAVIKHALVQEAIPTGNGNVEVILVGGKVIPESWVQASSKNHNAG